MSAAFCSAVFIFGYMGARGLRYARAIGAVLRLRIISHSPQIFWPVLSSTQMLASVAVAGYIVPFVFNSFEMYSTAFPKLPRRFVWKASKRLPKEMPARGPVPKRNPSMSAWMFVSARVSMHRRTSPGAGIFILSRTAFDEPPLSVTFTMEVRAMFGLSRRPFRICAWPVPAPSTTMCFVFGMGLMIYEL